MHERRIKLMLNYTAFDNYRILSQGGLGDVALAVKTRLEQDPAARILIFSDASGKQMDLDLSGTSEEVLDRLKVFLKREAGSNQGPGRPRLGVTSREVSLLPQHWEWL